MGGRAEVSTQIINKAATNAVIKTASTCEADANATIDVAMGVVHGNLSVGGTISQTATAQTSRCSQEDELTQMLKQNLDQSVKQAAGVSGLTLFGSTTSKYNQITDTINNMNVNDFKQCAPASDAALTQRYKQVMGNVTYAPVITQSVAGTVGTCIQNNTAIQQHIETLKTVLDSTAKTEGLSISVQWLITLAIVIVVGVIAFMLIRKSLTKTPAPQQ